MKILAIDTSTQMGSVAVLNNDKVCAEVSYQTKSSHAEVLIEEIDKVIKKAGFIIEDIDGFAVAIGPGSFTGLRIGLATAKGLAISNNKPIIGISTLEALHPPFTSSKQRGGFADEKGGQGGIIVPCINAYRGEVYASVYSHQRGLIFPECSISPDALCDKLLELNSSFMFIGDGAVRYKDIFQKKLGEKFIMSENIPSIAKNVGLLAFQRLKEDKTSDIVTFTPNYIRKPDAELKLLPSH